MGTVFELVIAVLLPTVVGGAAVLLVRTCRWRSARRPALVGASLESIGADLRRLHAQLDATETAARLPGKGLRIRAIRAAYLDALRDACARVNVPTPVTRPGAPVPLTEIYRVEAALRRHGLDVRAGSRG